MHHARVVHHCQQLADCSQHTAQTCNSNSKIVGVMDDKMACDI
jgi:hypothetical protein